MVDEGHFKWQDKAAAVLLGTPVLAGSIVLVLAFYSPGSAAYRDRANVAPIAAAAVVVGAVGGGFYLRWRSRRQAEIDLAARAAQGVLRLHPRLRTKRLVDVSVALADEFLLPPQSCDLAMAPAVTAGAVYQSILALIRRLEAEGRMLIDPNAIAGAQIRLIRFAAAGAHTVGMSTPLADVVPVGRRRALWRDVARDVPVKLPKLVTPRWGIAVAVVVSLAVVFGTTIPLAQWLDREHPVGHVNPLLSAAAKFLVKGGFLLALVVVAYAVGVLIRLPFPAFPPQCRTVGHLAAYAFPPRGRQTPAVPWPEADVWREVQRVVAAASGMDPAQVRPTTACA